MANAVQIANFPFHLVEEQHVKTVVQNDKGPQASFKSFKVEKIRWKIGQSIFDFKVTVNLENEETSYIAKVILLDIQDELLNDIIHLQFMKEAGAYRTILPALNEELALIKQPPFIFPKYFHSEQNELCLVIYMEDMTRSGYTSLNPTVGLQDSQTFLIMKELARFHAVSRIYLSKNKLTISAMKERFQCLKDMRLEYMNEQHKAMHEILYSKALSAIGYILFQTEGYEYAAGFLMHIRGKVLDAEEEVRSCSEPFAAVTHGALWEPNFMFR